MLPRVVLAALLCLLAAGCGGSHSSSNDAPELSELTGGTDLPAAAPSISTPAPKLHFRPGDRFPLEKTIFQKVSQGGLPVGTERLQLRLSLEVEAADVHGTRLSVRYHRLRMARDVQGEAWQYDSATGEPPPAGAMMFAGMVNNGFSFLLGPDLKIREIFGFEDFIRNCVALAPAADRDRLWSQLAGLGRDRGVADFIDDSLGLLPIESQLQEGYSWPLAVRTHSSPAAMNEHLRASIQRIEPQVIEIALLGNLVPQAGASGRVQLQPGQARGMCLVDRRTGIPTRSYIERSFDMLVTMDDGTQIAQTKETLTTITAYLNEWSSAEQRSGIQQVSAEQPAPAAVIDRPLPPRASPQFAPQRR